MKTFTRLVLSIAGVVVALGLVVVGFAEGKQPAAVRTHLMEAAYPTFASLGELAAKSPVIVRGEVTDLRPAQRVIPEAAPLAEMPREKAEHVGYLVTDVEVRVDKVLAGPAELHSSSILVLHLGGETATDRFVMADEPLSERGQSYLFFLEPTADGRYAMVGGAQGRFQVRGGRLEAIAEDARETAVGKELHGQAADRVEREFTTLVKHSKAAPQRPERQAPLTQPEGGRGFEAKPSGPPAGN